MNTDSIPDAQRLLNALGEDVRRGYVTPLNAIYLLLKERDMAHQEGTMGKPEFTETAQRLAAINDAILGLIRSAYHS